MSEGNLALPADLLGNIERYAVYRCYSDRGELLYVGESGELGKRLAAHAQKVWFTQVRGITLEWYADELDALAAERRAIHVEHPKYNKQHRGTTSAQVARKRPARRASRSRRTWVEVKAAAVEILRDEPAVSASELGRRLGVSDARGRQIVRRLAGADASGGAAPPLPRGRGETPSGALTRAYPDARMPAYPYTREGE